eukprot:COSAG02_NODE_449_length_22094_cov_4.917027_12_plen_87_part_00
MVRAEGGQDGVATAPAAQQPRAIISDFGNGGHLDLHTSVGPGRAVSTEQVDSCMMTLDHSDAKSSAGVPGTIVPVLGCPRMREGKK